MTWQIVSVAFDAVNQTFDPAPLAEAMAGREVDFAAPVVHGEGDTLRLFVLTRSTPVAVAETTDGWRGRLAATDRPTFDSLRLWRREEAATRGRPAYGILTNKALAGLAALRPRSVEELSAVPGIGSVTVDRYAERLLALVGE